jgi:hypothetical protein
MFGKLILSVVVATSLDAATLRVPAPSCVSTSAASEQSCRTNCCANKTCCATSPKRASLPSQPLTKSGASLELAAVIAKPTEVLLPTEARTPQAPIFLTSNVGHTRPTPVLLCTFLI